MKNEKREKEKEEEEEEKNRDERIKELIKEKINENDSAWFDFDGQNCHEWGYGGHDCKGWDGVSRRCHCGNRRVSWEYDSDYDCIKAEAY